MHSDSVRDVSLQSQRLNGLWTYIISRRSVSNVQSVYIVIILQDRTEHSWTIRYFAYTWCITMQQMICNENERDSTIVQQLHLFANYTKSMLCERVGDASTVIENFSFWCRQGHIYAWTK